uniref:Uncharacterized protein n=1 Tax=Oryza glumipatula TaxID=40148 RepID=A0A0E0BUD4_9ORYZ
MAAAGPSSSAPPRPGAGVVTMAAGRRGRGDGDGAELGAAVGRSTVSAPATASPDLVSPLGRVVLHRGDRRRARSSPAPFRGPGRGWLAVAMVADMAATKLATTAADCGACRDAGPRQEPRRHEGGVAPSSMLRL